MYDVNYILDKFQNLVGWRQNENSDFTINTGLTASESGLFFQDFHPLLTLNNIKSLYKITETETFNFSDKLRQKTNISILKALRRIMTEKMPRNAVAGIVENKCLFYGAASKNNKLPNDGKWVGFEINLARHEGVALKIKRLGLQVSKPDDTQEDNSLQLHLFHSSVNSPIKTQTITLDMSKAPGFQWFEVDIPPLRSNGYVRVTGDIKTVGGSYYLVYDQNRLGQLGVEAINLGRDFSMIDCGTCHEQDVKNWMTFSKFLGVHPFRVDPGEELELWDVENNIYTAENNYGLNLEISIYCDFSDIFAENRDLFKDLIGIQVAIDFLREMAYNPDFLINRTLKNLSMQNILYEVDGDSQGFKKSGLAHDFKAELERIQMDFARMSNICVPCNRRGISWK